jgi:hypothetical protein
MAGVFSALVKQVEMAFDYFWHIFIPSLNHVARPEPMRIP